MHPSPYIFDPSSFSHIPSAHPFDNGDFNPQHDLAMPSASPFDSHLAEQTGLHAQTYSHHHRQPDSTSTSNSTPAPPSFPPQHIPTTSAFDQVVHDFPDSAQIESFSSFHLGRPTPQPHSSLQALAFQRSYFDLPQHTSHSPGQSPDPLVFAHEAFYGAISPSGPQHQSLFGRFSSSSNTNQSLHDPSPPSSYPKQDYPLFPQPPNPNPSSPSPPHSSLPQPSNTFSTPDSGSSLDYLPSNSAGADHDDPYTARGVTTDLGPATHVSGSVPPHREDVVTIPPHEVFAQSRRVSEVSIRSADSNYMSSSVSVLISPRPFFAHSLPSY